MEEATNTLLMFLSAGTAKLAALQWFPTFSDSLPGKTEMCFPRTRLCVTVQLTTYKWNYCMSTHIYEHHKHKQFYVVIKCKRCHNRPHLTFATKKNYRFDGSNLGASRRRELLTVQQYPLLGNRVISKASLKVVAETKILPVHRTKPRPSGWNCLCSEQRSNGRPSILSGHTRCATQIDCVFTCMEQGQQCQHIKLTDHNATWWHRTAYRSDGHVGTATDGTHRAWINWLGP
jgi:hypothetical protein